MLLLVPRIPSLFPELLFSEQKQFLWYTVHTEHSTYTVHTEHRTQYTKNTGHSTHRTQDTVHTEHLIDSMMPPVAFIDF